MGGAHSHVLSPPTRLNSNAHHSMGLRPRLPAAAASPLEKEAGTSGIFSGAKPPSRLRRSARSSGSSEFCAVVAAKAANKGLGPQTHSVTKTTLPTRRYPPPQRRNGIPRERGRLARILIPANSLPSTATPSQSAPNPPLRGSLPSCQALCGRDARVPGGFFGESLAIRYANGRNDHQIDLLAGRRIRARAGGVGTPLGGAEVRSVAAAPCFWNESPTLTAYLGWSSPGSAGVSPASLFLQRASRPRPLPHKVHQTRLYGVLFNRARLCAGGTPAFPGGLVRARRPRSRGVLFDRLHCLHRLIREGCQRNERCEKSLQRTSSAMEADGLFVHQQRSDASLILGIHTNGKLCFWNESPTLTAYLGWSSPGSAGVSPASLFLQRASQPRPLPRKAHQTRLYGVLFPRARLCAGGTPAFPGGLVRAGRPRSRGVFTPTPFPSLGRPVPNLLQPLRAPSWIIPYPPPASARCCRVDSGSISRLPGRRTTP